MNRLALLLRSRWPLLLLLYPLVFLAHGLAAFPYPSASSIYSDFTIAHYPNYLFLQNSLQMLGRVPLWAPTMLSGFPFLANPLSGLWYPPGWLALLFPLPFGLNLLAALHLVWGGLGMYVFAKATLQKRWPALFSAMVFMLLPKVYAHYGGGHLTLVFAFAWTPWLLLSALHPRRFFRPAVLLAVIFLADPRWAVYAGLVWLAWSVYRASLLGNRGMPTPSFVQSIYRFALPMLWEGVVALLLVGPVLLPLLEYSRLSTRASLSAGDVLTLSLPPVQLLGLFFPWLATTFEWQFYPGVLAVFTLGLAGFVWRSVPYAKLWLGIAFGALLFSLGDAIPFAETAAALPGVNLLRVPPRFLFVFGFALANLAGLVLTRMLMESPDRMRVAALQTLGGLGLLYVGLGIGLSWLIPALTSRWALTGGLVLLNVLLFGFLFQRGLSPVTQKGALLGLLLVLLLDHGMTARSVLAFHPAANVLGEGAAVAAYLAGRPGAFRVYSPSYSIPVQTAARFGLELADGIDPLQLQMYADYMQAATGVARTGYSVTLPPFPGDPVTIHQGVQPNARLLGMLNVGYVVSAYPLAVPGLSLLARIDATWVYENLEVRPRAWLSEGGEVDWMQREPGRLEWIVTGPGLLTISEIAYPGWHLLVDGVGQPLQVVDDLLLGVEIPPGVHAVSLRFFPDTFRYGLILFVLGLGGLLWKRR